MAKLEAVLFTSSPPPPAAGYVPRAVEDPLLVFIVGVVDAALSETVEA